MSKKDVPVVMSSHSVEAQRLLIDHRDKFHSSGEELCIICRSLRRTAVRGLGL